MVTGVIGDMASPRFTGMVCMAAPITGEDTTDPIGKRELCPASRSLDKKQSFVQDAIVVLLASVDAVNWSRSYE